MDMDHGRPSSGLSAMKKVAEMCRKKYPKNSTTFMTNQHSTHPHFATSANCIAMLRFGWTGQEPRNSQHSTIIGSVARQHCTVPGKISSPLCMDTKVKNFLVCSRTSKTHLH